MSLQVDRKGNHHETSPTSELMQISQSLKNVRRQKGWTLREVERISQGKWKAVVIGSYERMDRALTLKRALELAQFYELPLAELLGIARTSSARALSAAGATSSALTLDLRLDLRRLRSTPEFDSSAFGRFIRFICQERQDWNGEVLTLRKSDGLALSALCGAPQEDLLEWFESKGVLFKSRERV